MNSKKKVPIWDAGTRHRLRLAVVKSRAGAGDRGIAAAVAGRPPTAIASRLKFLHACVLLHCSCLFAYYLQVIARTTSAEGGSCRGGAAQQLPGGQRVAGGKNCSTWSVAFPVVSSVQCWSN